MADSQAVASLPASVQLNQPQSMAPAAQQQYPTELGTNPIVQQGYQSLEQARQGLQTQARNQPNMSNVQSLIDMAAQLKSAAPSNDQFEKDRQDVIATKAKVAALSQKGLAMMAERHPARNAIIGIAGLLGPLGTA